MFSKKNIKWLIILFAILLLLVVVRKYTGEQKNRSFKKDLLTLDTTEITGMIISSVKQEEDVKLYKYNEKWFVKQGEEEYIADPAKIGELKNTLAKLEPERVVGLDKKSWEKYDVTDSMGIKIKIQKDEEVVDELVLGRFDYQRATQQSPQQMYYNKPQGRMISYVRRADGDKVFAVDGFLKMTFQPSVSNYRDKTVLNSDKGKWTKLAFIYPADSSFTIKKKTNSNDWLINGKPLDSASVASYLSDIEKLKSSHFIKNESGVAANITHKLRIEGTNMSPIEISASPADSVNRYAIRTTENKQAIFSGAKLNLFEKIFVGKQKLLQREKPNSEVK